MNPDVVAGISRLERDGVLSPEQAGLVRPVADGTRLSLYYELRFLLYAGVLLLTAGVGVLVQQNLDRVGPVTIAVAIGAAALGCLAWVERNAPVFSWHEAVSTHLAFDYVLLLGVLLASADLAYIEARFTPLGENWSWHLFWMSVFMAGLALRYDSRVVFTLALTTFASWRGISAATFGEEILWSESATRMNGLLCGAVFVALGGALLHFKKKPHFEPVASFLGWLLISSALLSGAIDDDARAWWRMALLVTGFALAAHAFVRRRFWLFVMGVLTAYAALSILVVDALEEDAFVFSWFLVTSMATLFALTRVHRRLSA